MPLNAGRRIQLVALAAIPFSSSIVLAENAPSRPASEMHVFDYHDPARLGTTLDLKLVAPTKADADACEQKILREIDRLAAILSTYQPNSEISRFAADPSTAPIAVSPELHAVLADYVYWRDASGGAFSAQLGELIGLWSAAQKQGVTPSDAVVAPLVAQADQDAIAIGSDFTVQKLSAARLNIDSLGKGFIVQRAAALAKAQHPLVTGILLNIGGDITALGFATPPGERPAQTWKINIADPRQYSDGAPPLMRLSLRDQAVATSGTYERFYEFGDRRLSHILDPRTGKPSDNGVLSATVVADDNTTANALATILCVVPPQRGIELVEKTAGASALVVMSDGQQLQSSRLVHLASGQSATEPTPPPATQPAPGDPWPKNYSLAVDLNELPFPRHPSEIPYTTLWIEDASGHCVKILAAWIGDEKYLPKMRRFPMACKQSPDFATMTRATRPIGHYKFDWDGTDAAGNPVLTGDFTLCIEVCCDHGGRSLAKKAFTCGPAASNTTVPGAMFWTPINLKYGPANSKSDTR